MRNKAVFITVLWSIIIGGLIAFSVAWFAGTVYREGSFLAPFVALMVAASLPFALYEESTKRITGALFTAALVSALSLLVVQCGGQIIGPTLFGLSIVAVAIPIGVNLIAQDFGTRLTISPMFSHGVATVFLAAVLPLSASMIIHEHYAAVAEDDALIRTVAQNVSPEGDTIVFDQVDPRQKDKLKKLVSVRTKARTYRLSDADIESVVQERTVRREGREQQRTAVVSREQDERMRIILKLQGAPVPEDIVVFSQRGPVTVSELKVSLDKKQGS